MPLLFLILLPFAIIGAVKSYAQICLQILAE